MNLGSNGGSEGNGKKNKENGNSGVKFWYHSKEEYIKLNRH